MEKANNNADLVKQLEWGINKEAHVPLYDQVKKIIYNKIMDGYWAEGQLIPSERELGQMLGVSRITVIRAFKELTDEGFLKREKGKGTFVTGLNAAGVSGKRIGVVIHQAEFFADSFFSDIVAGIQDIAAKLGFELALLPYADNLSEVKEGFFCIQNALQKKLSGIIITVEEINEDELARLSEHKIPFVVINKELQSLDGDQLPIDWAKGTYELAKHLVKRGHRNLGYLGGLWGKYRSDSAKYSGFHQALAEAGLKLNTDWLVEWEYQRHEGISKALDKLLLGDPRPTAILCCDDHLAAQLIKRCYQRGLKVPADVAIAGVGDLQIANNVYPGITTLHVDRYKLGQDAVLMIKSRLDNYGAQYVHKRSVPYIVVRESTGEKDHLLKSSSGS